MLYEANMSNSKATSDACLKSYWFSLSNQYCLREGLGLHFKWCHGEAVGVGNQHNCVGVPTTFGRHCLNLIFKEGYTALFTSPACIDS